VLWGQFSRTTEDGHARMTVPQITMKQPTFVQVRSLLRALGALAEMMCFAEHDGRK
jgi:hypothetical protein